MTFPEKLHDERRRLGLTQAEAAALLDTPARTYWEWENKKTAPPAIAQEGAIARLAKAKPRRQNSQDLPQLSESHSCGSRRSGQAGDY